MQFIPPLPSHSAHQRSRADQQSSKPLPRIFFACLAATVLHVGGCASTQQIDLDTFAKADVAPLTSRGTVIFTIEEDPSEPHRMEPRILNGVTTYMGRYAPNWKVVSNATNPSLALTCKRIRDGMTNCAQMQNNCEVKRKRRLVNRLVIEIESQACGKGGDDDSYYAEGHNNGLEIGRRLTEFLRTYGGIDEIEREERIADEFAEAKKADSPSALESFIARYPEAKEVDKARIIVQRRKEARERKARSPKPAPPATAPTATNTQPPATSTAQAQKSKTKNPEDRKKKKAASALTLTCHDTRRYMCGEYTFPNKDDLKSFRAQCVQLGSKASDGKNCPEREGVKGCRHRSGGRTVVTFSYVGSQDAVRGHCEQTQGDIVDG